MKETPESKLLTLIQRSAPSANAGGALRRRRAARDWIVRALGGQFHHFLNRCLFMLAAGLALASVAVWGRAVWGPPDASAGRPPVGVDAGPAEGSDAPFGGLSTRDLFGGSAPPSIPARVPPPPALTPPAPPRIPLSQRLSHLRLVGIIDGARRQAVLDDARQGTTRYVSAGDAVGEARVERVEKDRVVFSFDGETMDLSL